MQLKKERVKTLVEAIAISGYSRKSYSKRIGISEGYLSQIINHGRSVSPRVAQQLLAPLHFETRDFFTCSVRQKLDLEEK